MSANILNPGERQKLNTIPEDISDGELVRFFTLSANYLAALNRQVSPAHLLDRAAHICLLRWLGWSPVEIDRLPQTALVALCEQLMLPVPVKLPQLPGRTSRRHAQRAREYLGWHKYTDEWEHALGEWLKPLAEQQDRGRILLDALLGQLYRRTIVRPGLAHLERLVESTRFAIREQACALVNAQLSDEQKERLDGLTIIADGELRSPLQRLKETPPTASGPQLLITLQKIKQIQAMELDKLDLSGIHPNRIKLLAKRARRRENWATAQLKPEQRHLQLVCLLSRLLPSLIDQAVEMYGQIIKSVFRRAETKRNAAVLERGQRLNNKVLLLAQIARLILDEDNIPDAQLRSIIYRSIERERLTHTVHECDELAQPADYAPFTFAARSYPYLRRFGPALLRALEFQSDEEEAPSLLKAIDFMG